MMLSVAASLSGLMRLFVGWNGLPAPAAGQLYVGQKVPAPPLLKFHSHNDYVQPVPLFAALAAGVNSVEADVWLVNGTLFVGHTGNDLTPNRTFANMYLEPIMTLLTAYNTTPALLKEWPALKSLPLQLLVDMKTDGPETFDAVYDALEPFRSASMLTTWTAASNSSRPAQGLLTVVGTGNTPPDSVRALGQPGAHKRDLFLDADLADLPADASPALSPLASAILGMPTVGPYTHYWMPWYARRQIRRLVRAARAKDIPTRFYSIPKNPAFVRWHVWNILLEEGVDYLNVDEFADLPAPTVYDGTPAS